jgi:hypothetical protein
MFAKTKIALSVALILGAVSAALAYDSGESNQDENNGSVAGVNHLTRPGNSASAGGAYGYAAAPIHKRRHLQEQTQSVCRLVGLSLSCDH